MENKLNLSEIIERYINYIDIKTETKRGYKKILEEYSVYITKLTDSPKRSDLLAYREYLKSRLRASSVQKYIVVIRNFYSWCHIEGFGDNIAEGIKGVKIQSDFKREALSVNEAHKLLLRAKLHSTKSIEGLRNYAIIALLLTTGLRTIEVERADVADINEVNDIKILYVMGKGHDDKDTFVKLSPQVYEIIERYLIERGDQFEPLFISQHTKTKGERLKTRSIRGIVKELLRQIGIDNKKYSAHSLRHTAATISLMEGGNIEETQALLRHKELTTTQIYVHRLDKMKGDLEMKVSDAIFGNPKKKIDKRKDNDQKIQ